MATNLRREMAQHLLRCRFMSCTLQNAALPASVAPCPANPGGAATTSLPGGNFADVLMLLVASPPPTTQPAGAPTAQAGPDLSADPATQLGKPPASDDPPPLPHQPIAGTDLAPGTPSPALMPTTIEPSGAFTPSQAANSTPAPSVGVTPAEGEPAAPKAPDKSRRDRRDAASTAADSAASLATQTPAAVAALLPISDGASVSPAAPAPAETDPVSGRAATPRRSMPAPQPSSAGDIADGAPAPPSVQGGAASLPTASAAPAVSPAPPTSKPDGPTTTAEADAPARPARDASPVAPPAVATAGLTQPTTAASAAMPEAPHPAHASPAAQLAPALVFIGHAANGTQRLTVRLQPAELGQVEVKVERAPGAPVRVEITVQRPETLALLQRDQPQLQRALDQAGLPADGRSLTLHVAPPTPAVQPAQAADLASGFGMGAGGTGGGSHGSSGQPSPVLRWDGTAEPDEAELAVAGAVPGRHTGLDITA